MSTNVMEKFRFINPQKSRLEIAHNAFRKAHEPKRDFFIETAVIRDDDGLIDVCYVDKDTLESGMISETDWKSATISLQKLEAFAGEDFNGSGHDFEQTNYHFITENLHLVLKAYLDAGKEIESC